MQNFAYQYTLEGWLTKPDCTGDIGGGDWVTLSAWLKYRKYSTKSHSLQQFFPCTLEETFIIYPHLWLLTWGHCLQEEALAANGAVGTETGPNRTKRSKRRRAPWAVPCMIVPLLVIYLENGFSFASSRALLQWGVDFVTCVSSLQVCTSVLRDYNCSHFFTYMYLVEVLPCLMFLGVGSQEADSLFDMTSFMLRNILCSHITHF